MEFSREAFGSRLDITIDSQHDVSDVLDHCFALVSDFEQKYSRFIKGNFLDVLNTNKSSEIPSELLSILRLSLKVSQLTQGYFDITLLPVLENMGYGKSDTELLENTGYENIKIQGNILTLEKGVSIDLGAVGKGYIVDVIYNKLIKKSDSFVINFGGDIRVHGAKNILLEDPFHERKTIGHIDIENMAIASSNGNKRKIQAGHHLINAKTHESQNDKIAIYVTHKLASFADIFSTALFVTPLELSLKILEQTPGLEALIISQDGSMYKSKGFNCTLNTNNAGA